MSASGMIGCSRTEKWKYGNALQERHHDLLTVAMAAQDTEFETNEVGPGNVTTKNGQPILFVMFGRLTYRELNESIHHTGFALEVSPHIAAFSRYYNRAYDYYD